MEKLVSEMVAFTDLLTVRNVILGLVRDGVIFPPNPAWVLPIRGADGIIREAPINVSVTSAHLSMLEQQALGNSTRAVWCVGQSAVTAECFTPNRTLLKRLAVKGIIYLDGDARAEWFVLRNRLSAMELLLPGSETTRILAGADGAEAERMESDMVMGKMPALPDERAYRERQTAPDGTGSQDVVTDLSWEVVLRKWHCLEEQFKEIQRLKSYSVEEATVLYFAEMDAGGVNESQPLVAPSRRGGRPRLSDNEWAYEQVRVKGREAQEVYSEWLKRIGSRAKALADPRDSFNKAIKERSRKNRK